MPNRLITASLWWLARLVAILAFVVGLVPLAATRVPPARAQEPESAISLTLKAQPVSYRPGDRLGIKVQIHNDFGVALEGFDLQVSAYDKVSSRSALHETFEGTPSGPFASFPMSFDRRVDPGTSTMVKINNRISELAPLNQTADGGVYPMTISLLNEVGLTVDSLTTELMYYPAPVETPLNMSLVVPLNAPPARGPDGVFRFRATTPGAAGDSLLEGLAPSGWLATTVATLDLLTDENLQVAIAPTPRLMDEIADLEDGYSVDEGAGVQEIPENATTRAAGAFMDDVGDLLQRRGVQPLLVPYSLPDLPGLEEHSEADIGAQLTQGQDVLRSALDVDVGRSWVFPPAGRLNADTIEALKQAGAENLFFSPSSLGEMVNPLVAGCPEPALSFACPAAVKSALGGTTIGYAADADVQDRLAALARPGSDRLELQRFFAETAIIREELPGRSDRIISASLPALWQPSAKTTRLLYGGLATAPWLRTITPEAGLELGIEVAEREAVDVLPESPNQLIAADYADITEANDVVQSFSEMEPPTSLLQRLQRNILVAESRSWWSDVELARTGLEYASTAAEEAVREMDKVDVAINKVVLTSSKGKILLSVENSADYPVRIRIRVESLKLAPDPPLIDARFEEGLTREFVDVTARATGIFSLEVTVTTPDDGYLIQQLSRPVRSTEFNRIALGITIGALLFLIGFYIQRWFKRRHSRRSSTAVVKSA